jgi:MerR HTH family regulatory protein
MQVQSDGNANFRELCQDQQRPVADSDQRVRGAYAVTEIVTGEHGSAGVAQMAPPLGRLYLTSDLRAMTSLARTHMDFYLREGIIQPCARTGSGMLLFDEGELEILRTVLRWRDEGVGIREIRERLGRPAIN